MGLEFCLGSEGSTVLEAQVRKGAVHPSPTAGEGAQLQGGGAPRSLGPQAQMNMLGVLLEGGSQGGQITAPAIALPTAGCSGLRAHSWPKSVLAGAWDVWVTLPSSLVRDTPFSARAPGNHPVGLPQALSASPICRRRG